VTDLTTDDAWDFWRDEIALEQDTDIAVSNSFGLMHKHIARALVGLMHAFHVTCMSNEERESYKRMLGWVSLGFPAMAFYCLNKRPENTVTLHFSETLTPP